MIRDRLFHDDRLAHSSRRAQQLRELGSGSKLVSVRERFTAALDSLVDQVRSDRSVLAAILIRVIRAVRRSVVVLLSAAPMDDVTRTSLGTALAAEALCLPAGFTLGPYRVVRLLGRGGMGEVYEAEQVEHQRRVALKILSRRLEAGDREQFLSEGRIAASIAHSNTVYVFGSETIDGVSVIAMELLPGGTLKDLVDRDGPLAPGAAVDAILQVVAGLEAAQAAGILHRDVKPQTCFTAPDGTVKVGDVGLSISSSAREPTEHLGMFQGTPQYAAPEQLHGEPLDARADIYAVGGTLYFMTTVGTISLREETFQAMLTDVVHSFKMHGFENIILIGDSGGNTAGMRAVAQKLTAEWKGAPVVAHIGEYYDYASVLRYLTELGVTAADQKKDGLHDDPAITLNMLAADSNSVRWEQRVKGKKAAIDGVSIADRKKALAIAQKIIEKRASVTAEAIRKAIAGRPARYGRRPGSISRNEARLSMICGPLVRRILTK